MTDLVVVDYGMGNLHSVIAAFRYLGCEPVVSGEPSRIARANIILLPGVGSFRKAMLRLDNTGLSDAIREAVAIRKRKILGICLGQQLMAEYGDEDGGCAGLGLVSGSVTCLPAVQGLKVPHIGFNSVRFEKSSQLAGGLTEAVDFYFVHSYRLTVEKRPGLQAICDYGGDFVASYEHENVFATQFHPEKSQTNGLRLLSNFLAV